jgi:hypothetical protein
MKILLVRAKEVETNLKEQIENTRMWVGIASKQLGDARKIMVVTPRDVKTIVLEEHER